MSPGRPRKPTLPLVVGERAGASELDLRIGDQAGADRVVGLDVTRPNDARHVHVQLFVVDHGAGDLLELHGRGMKDTILLPFTQAIVPTVDLAAGRIVIDPPDGIIGD